MSEYHKINALFMRDMDKPGHPLIPGAWAQPEFEYLANNQWEFTEKVDGTNIRVEFDLQKYEVSFKGRTDNASIPVPLLEYLEETFTPYDMQKAGLSQVVLYGEGYGPKIQSGGNYRKDQSFVLFDVKIDHWWLNRDDVNDIGAKLGIDTVPVVGAGTLWDAVDMVSTVPSASVFEGHGPLKSQWGDFEAEGIVARPVVPLFTRSGSRVIAKIKARDFR